MWDLIVATLATFLPAYAANMAPVLATRWNLLPSLARPIDGGRKTGGHSIFGPHKTVRGLLTGLVLAVVVAELQTIIGAHSNLWGPDALVPTDSKAALLWGLALGGGALGGDLLKSFFKRRLGIPPGARWFPWDQLDMVIGALVGGSFLVDFPFPMIIMVLVLTPFMGLLVNLGAYALKVKEAW